MSWGSWGWDVLQSTVSAVSETTTTLCTWLSVAPLIFSKWPGWGHWCTWGWNAKRRATKETRRVCNHRRNWRSSSTLWGLCVPVTNFGRFDQWSHVLGKCHSGVFWLLLVNPWLQFQLTWLCTERSWGCANNWCKLGSFTRSRCRNCFHHSWCLWDGWSWSLQHLDHWSMADNFTLLMSNRQVPKTSHKLSPSSFQTLEMRNLLPRLPNTRNLVPNLSIQEDKSLTVSGVFEEASGKDYRDDLEQLSIQSMMETQKVSREWRPS